MSDTIHSRRSSMIHRRPSQLPPLTHLPAIDAAPDTVAGPTPLPVWQLLPLIIGRIAEGMTYTVIFPYVNAMLLSFGVEEKAVGFWSGVVESTLMVAEAISAPMYAPLADRVGRRPVFLTLLALWGVGGNAFGFCTTVWAVIVTRTWLGFLAGCGVLSRTMLGELCNKSNRVQGFAFFTPAFTIGVTIGPLVGGYLAEPVPRLLSPSFSLFAEYPYALPALVVASFSILATVTGFFLLKETLPPKGHQSSGGGLKKLLGCKPFRFIIILYTITNGVQFSWEAVFPLFAFTGVKLGGMGLDIQTIGIVLALSALLSIFMTAFIFPVLHRALPGRLYLTLCLAAYPTAVLFFPLIWWSSKDGLGVSAWLFLGVQMFVRRLGDFSATLLDTLVLDAIPGPEHLAMANSIAFSTSAVGRAIGPFIISSCFAISTRHTGFIGRSFVWLTFIVLSIPPVVLAQRLELSPGDPQDVEERHELISAID